MPRPISRLTFISPTLDIAANNSPGWSPIQGAFWRAGKIAPGLRLEEVLPEFTRRSEQWLADFRQQGAPGPFFLYIALAAPHTPWLPTERFAGQSAVQMYGDFVMEVDHAVGRIVAALDRHGFADNTLFVFTSDNGPTWYREDEQRWGHAAAGGFRGMKGDAWEGGHRMPFIARWPGKIAAGAVSHRLVCLTDVMATAAALAEATLPDGAGEDSYNLAPVLLGTASDEAPREVLVVRSSRGHWTIRQGDWKLISALGSGGFSPPAEEKPAPDGPRGQLYHLARDPGETTNLWAREPEVVARLSRLLDHYRDQGHRAGPPPP